MANGLELRISAHGLPSSADLDAIAAEQLVREATSGHPERFIELPLGKPDPLAEGGEAVERLTHEEAARRFVSTHPAVQTIVDDFDAHVADLAETEGVCTPFPCPDQGIPPMAILSSVERWNGWVRIVESVGLITRERAAVLILPAQVMPVAVEA